MMTTTVTNPCEHAAERAMTLMLMLSQREAARRSAAAAGEDDLTSSDLAGKTLGIVGYGKVGQALARRAHFGFGMNVLVFDRARIAENALAECHARSTSTLDELLAASDVVSLHCPDTADNLHLIKAQQLNAMKPTAYLVNTSHGDLIEEQALTQALWFETIAGVGLDPCDRNVAHDPALLSDPLAIVLAQSGPGLAQAA